MKTLLVAASLALLLGGCVTVPVDEYGRPLDYYPYTYQSAYPYPYWPYTYGYFAPYYWGPPVFVSGYWFGYGGGHGHWTGGHWHGYGRR